MHYEFFEFVLYQIGNFYVVFLDVFHKLRVIYHRIRVAMDGNIIVEVEIIVFHDNISGNVDCKLRICTTFWHDL